jgi:DNA repair protein RAD50
MEEVNRIIYEVWKEIYHGNDIDHIEIKAFLDEDAGKKKKNYNYSIVMQKITQNHKLTDKKIDMKGRCSMGQKVLASIVIRLALAEAFSTNTRILALDEPTTNLDREHINNLAFSLGKLI